jgi:hypothetical protein
VYQFLFSSAPFHISLQTWFLWKQFQISNSSSLLFNIITHFLSQNGWFMLI